MPKSIIIKKNGGPDVLELQDVNVGSPGVDEIKVTTSKAKGNKCPVCWKLKINKCERSQCGLIDDK